MMTREELAEHMRDMGEPESSVQYQLARTITWNGNPVTVREPARNWPNENTGD